MENKTCLETVYMWRKLKCGCVCTNHVI